MKTKILGMITLLLMAGGALATTRTWQLGSGTGDWFDPLNWDGQTTVPAAGDDVVVNTGGTVLLTNSTPALASLSLVGTLMFTNWNTVLSATTVTVSSGGVLTLPPAYESETPLHRIQIECEDFTLASGASVNISARGHAGKAKASGFGPGKGNQPKGAGHGGQGLPFDGVYYFGSPYGDPVAPILPGSAGGAQWTARGGHGGGAIRIAATGAVHVDGAINAAGEGGYNADGTYSGGGSGGSVYIQCETFSGASSGLVDVSGGSTPQNNNGAGGRIAIHYDVAKQALLPVPQVTFRAKPGNALRADSMGSLYLSDGSWVVAPFTRFEGVWFHGAWAANWTFTGDFSPINGIGFGQPSATVNIAGDLVLNQTCLGLSGGSQLRCDNLVLTNGGSMSVLSAYTPVPATATTTTQYGSLVEASGRISLASGSWVYPFVCLKPYSGIANTNGVAPLFRAAQVSIDTNAGFNAMGFGPPGGGYNVNPWGTGNGNASGRGYGRRDGAGAAHGGSGTGGTLAQRYGSAFAPVFPGSGGGAGYRGTGAPGGGAIRLQATGVVELNGTLTAEAGPHNGDAQGASGGSVFVLAGAFRGGPQAVMKANGGSGNTYSHGGGGRIAVGIGLTEDEIAGLFTGASHGRLIVSTNDVKYAGTANVDAGGATAQPGTIQFMTIRRGTAILIR